MIFTFPPTLTPTTAFFVLCLGVLLGLLSLVSPALLSLPFSAFVSAMFFLF
jgi:hypothetical protein